ncbi:protein of unknown function [Shinella sp. WSC3-e]|nr:hypothetical protein SHINE37_40471 [Rhizobiaceae bacterium]CAK7255149.1 protein of unknown function [Shinella sp. WSC3-e]
MNVLCFTVSGDVAFAIGSIMAARNKQVVASYPFKSFALDTLWRLVRFPQSDRSAYAR